MPAGIPNQISFAMHPDTRILHAGYPSNRTPGPYLPGPAFAGTYVAPGDRRRALAVFRRVLEIDPRHADAHNHLGIAALDTKKATVAERHFRAAVDGGTRVLERDGVQ